MSISYDTMSAYMERESNRLAEEDKAVQKQIADDAIAKVMGTQNQIYTNIGKSQIRSYDTKLRKEVQLNRSASLPLKLARSGNRIAVLNRDGSISWYNAGNGTVLADWYMTTEKQWFEF